MMEYIEENDLEGQIEVVASEAEPFMEIELGRADATFGSIILFDHKCEKGDYNLKFVGDCVGVEEHVFPFRLDADQEFLDEFNRHIRDMKEDGFLSELYMEYLDLDVSKPFEEYK